MPTFDNPISTESEDINENTFLYIVKIPNTETYALKGLSSAEEVNQLGFDPSTRAEEFWPLDTKKLLTLKNNETLFPDNQLSTQPIKITKLTEILGINPTEQAPQLFNQSVQLANLNSYSSPAPSAPTPAQPVSQAVTIPAWITNLITQGINPTVRSELLRLSTDRETREDMVNLGVYTITPQQIDILFQHGNPEPFLELLDNLENLHNLTDSGLAFNDLVNANASIRRNVLFYAPEIINLADNTAIPLNQFLTVSVPLLKEISVSRQAFQNIISQLDISLQTLNNYNAEFRHLLLRKTDALISLKEKHNLSNEQMKKFLELGESRVLLDHPTHLSNLNSLLSQGMSFDNFLQADSGVRASLLKSADNVPNFINKTHISLDQVLESNLTPAEVTTILSDPQSEKTQGILDHIQAPSGQAPSL